MGLYHSFHLSECYLKRLEKKENGLRNNCTILSRLLEEYKEIVPLAKKIVAMNIGIKELLVFDTASVAASAYSMK